MKRKHLNSVIAILLFVLIVNLLPGCITVQSPGTPFSMQEDAAVALIKSTTELLAPIDQELDVVAIDLKAANIKLLKLQQVGIPSQNWITEMTVQSEKEQWSPRRLNMTTDLKQLRNDTYEVVKLQFSVESVAPKRTNTSVVTIYEIATAKEYRYDDLRADLQAKVDGLKLILKSRTDNMLLAISTIKDVVTYYPGWKAVKVDSSTFSIRGPGLGLAAAPVVGEWKLSTALGKITPVDAPATALLKVLSGQG